MVAEAVGPKSHSVQCTDMFEPLNSSNNNKKKIFWSFKKTGGNLGGDIWCGEVGKGISLSSLRPVAMVAYQSKSALVCQLLTFS